MVEGGLGSIVGVIVCIGVIIVAVSVFVAIACNWYCCSGYHDCYCYIRGIVGIGGVGMTVFGVGCWGIVL